MRTPQFLILRGSSPTLRLKLPERPDAADVIYLSFSQGGRVRLEYAINGAASPAGTGTLAVDAAEEDVLDAALSQADTLRLDAGTCTLQLRQRAGTEARTYLPVEGYVGQALKQGEI